MSAGASISVIATFHGNDLESVDRIAGLRCITRSGAIAQLCHEGLVADGLQRSAREIITETRKMLVAIYSIDGKIDVPDGDEVVWPLLNRIDDWLSWCHDVAASKVLNEERTVP